MVLVRACLVCTHGERGVEQQNPLVCPACEVALCGRYGSAKVAIDLFDDIHQRWGHFYALWHRETQSVGLSGFMVRVLPQDDHLHLVERSVVEGSKDATPGRVTDMLLSLGNEKLFELGKVGCFKLRSQCFQPAGFYLGVCHGAIAKG